MEYIKPLFSRKRTTPIFLIYSHSSILTFKLDAYFTYENNILADLF